MDNKVRGFEIVRDDCRKFPDIEPTIPQRKTNHSAGYDLSVIHGDIIPAHSSRNFPMDIKVYMPEDEVFILNVRSSTGFKKGLRLINTQGWIDSDFYNNPDNDGNLSVCLFNPTDHCVVIEDGERVAQGIFIKYYTKDNDEQDVKQVRQGGIGSTGRE